MTPCVLPLVPGYLSAVSAVEARRLGEPGTRGAGRAALASRSSLGFTVVFVLLGAGAAAIGSVFSKRAQNEIAGFILIVVGLGFIGLLPWPERAVAPGLLQRRARIERPARRRLRRVRRAVHRRGARLDPRARGDSGAVVRGVALLTAYSLGLGAAFVLAGVAFTRAMGWFRWIRDRYRIIQIAGGVTLVALGLLLFFERYWWLNVALNRVLEKVGLDQI